MKWIQIQVEGDNMSVEIRRDKWKKRTKQESYTKVTVGNSWTEYKTYWDAGHVDTWGEIVDPLPYIGDPLPDKPKKLFPEDSSLLSSLQYMALLDRIQKLEAMVTAILEKLASMEKELNPSVRGREVEKT
jgi:hypothetical protein